MTMPDIQRSDVFTALALLSRLPLGGADFDRSAVSTWAFPITGVILAAIACALAGLAGWFGLPPAFQAIILTLGLTLMTGAMHEDGLADCADGFWGGWDQTRRLEIMKDSQIGTYGVMALVGVFALRATALTALISAGKWGLPVLAAAAMARGTVPFVMATVTNARGSGLSHTVGRPETEAAWLAGGVALAIGLIGTGFGVIGLAILGIGLTWGLTRLAMARIGGQTGDVLGMIIIVTETAILVALVP